MDSWTLPAASAQLSTLKISIIIWVYNFHSFVHSKVSQGLLAPLLKLSVLTSSEKFNIPPMFNTAGPYNYINDLSHVAKLGWKGL